MYLINHHKNFIAHDFQKVYRTTAITSFNNIYKTVFNISYDYCLWSYIMLKLVFFLNIYITHTHPRVYSEYLKNRIVLLV